MTHAEVVAWLRGCSEDMLTLSGRRNARSVYAVYGKALRVLLEIAEGHAPGLHDLDARVPLCAARYCRSFHEGCPDWLRVKRFVEEVSRG